MHTLSPKDREIFVFDVRNINWDKYVERYVLGFREFLFKQRPESLPASRKRMVRYVQIVHITFELQFNRFALYCIQSL